MKGKLWCFVVVIGFCLLLHSAGDVNNEVDHQGVNTSSAGVPSCVSLTAHELPTTLVPLPTNITVMSPIPDWQFDFTIQRTEGEEPLVCIRLGAISRSIKVSLFVGRCEDQNLVDSQLWRLIYMMPREWTMIDVTQNQSSILLQLEEGEPTSLAIKDITLPARTSLRVTFTRGVNIALTCPVNCPALQGSTPGSSDLSTVAELKNMQETFFFKPGRDFKKLNIEITCITSPKGYKILPEIELTQADIEDITHLQQWNMVFLIFDNSTKAFEIDINYQTAKEVTQNLQECDIFESFKVRVAGESYFSFVCNPMISDVNVCVHKDESAYIMSVIFIIVLIGSNVTVLVYMVYLILSTRKSQKSSVRSVKRLNETQELLSSLNFTEAPTPGN